MGAGMTSGKSIMGLCDSTHMHMYAQIVSTMVYLCRDKKTSGRGMVVCLDVPLSAHAIMLGSTSRARTLMAKGSTMGKAAVSASREDP